MSQKILSHTAFSDANMYVACPQCEHPNKIELQSFVAAINRYALLTCVACKAEYKISLLRQIRVAEQRDAPVHAEQKKAICQCKVIHSDYETQSNICCDCRKPLFSNRSAGG